MNHGASLLGVVLLSTLFVAALLAVMFYFDLQSYFVGFLHWLEGHGMVAYLIFIAINTLIVVFLLPGIMVTMGAGFLFGVIPGVISVVIATTMGAMIAYFVARGCLSERVAQYLLNHPKLKLLREEFVGEGWRFILLTRMVPFFPFKLSNYFFGLTRFSTRDFFVGTLFGIVPITTFNVYLGSLVADIAQLDADIVARSPLAWVFYGFGFVVTVIAVVYVSRHATRALGRYESR